MAGRATNWMETLIGAMVLLMATFFVVFAYNKSQIKLTDGYPVRALFERIDGLTIGNDVRLGGVKVGTVVGQKVDKVSFMAEVTFTVQNDLKLPLDTTASIFSDGLLGGKYITLQPGGAEETLQPNAIITNTEGSINLESLIGKAIFQGDKEK